MTYGIFLSSLFHFNLNSKLIYPFYSKFWRKTLSDTQRQNCCQHLDRICPKSPKSILSVPSPPFQCWVIANAIEHVRNSCRNNIEIGGEGGNAGRRNISSITRGYRNTQILRCKKNVDNKIWRWVSESQWPQ